MRTRLGNWAWAAVVLAPFCISLGLQIAEAAIPTSSQLAAMSRQLSGQLIPVQQDNFAYANTLQNYLRRGKSEFAASEPGLYLVAESENDVVMGVKMALDNQLKVAFHGSGHHQAGTSLYPGGITIDVSNLKAADIDPDTRIARLQMGLYGLEIANLTSEYNLHYRIGHASSVGIAGFTLGGGGGWGGLAIDQVRGFDVVNVWEYPAQELAIKRVDADNYPDLYFAMQGGGQMVGAVVAIIAKLDPLPADGLIYGPLVPWPLERAAEGWDQWLAYTESNTPSPYLETGFVYAVLPGLGPAAMLALFDWTPAENDQTGTHEFVSGLLDMAQGAGAPIMNQTLPYLETIQSFSPQQQYPGVTSYAISAIIPPENQKAASDILNAGFANVTSPLSNIIVDYPTLLDGKSNNDTAYGWRGNAVIYVWAFWTRTAGGAAVDGDAVHVAWVRDIIAQLEPLSLGYYINILDFEHPEDTRNSFPAENWVRVEAAKARYDPDNLFRELDFYHNKDGYGPLDAAPNGAVKAIST